MFFLLVEIVLNNDNSAQKYEDIYLFIKLNSFIPFISSYFNYFIYRFT